MASFRIIECPRGNFQLQRKGWLLWRNLCFHKSQIGKWIMESYPNYMLNPMWAPPAGAVYSFSSQKVAQETLDEAIAETDYYEVRDTFERNAK